MVRRITSVTFAISQNESALQKIPWQKRKLRITNLEFFYIFEFDLLLLSYSKSLQYTKHMYILPSTQSHSFLNSYLAFRICISDLKIKIKNIICICPFFSNGCPLCYDYYAFQFHLLANDFFQWAGFYRLFVRYTHLLATHLTIFWKEMFQSHIWRAQFTITGYQFFLSCRLLTSGIEVLGQGISGVIKMAVLLVK